MRFWQDLRYGCRGLRNHPGFTVVTVLTLALGIGTNTAIFSVVDAVMLRPLPYREPDRLVLAGERRTQGRGSGFSAANLLDWREQNQVFEHLAGFSNTGFNLSAAGQLPERVDGMRVTWNFFETLGVPPGLGRGFT